MNIVISLVVLFRSRTQEFTTHSISSMDVVKGDYMLSRLILIANRWREAYYLSRLQHFA
jgi:hypothetical protein